MANHSFVLAVAAVAAWPAAAQDSLQTVTVTGRAPPSAAIGGFDDVPLSRAPFGATVLGTAELTAAAGDPEVVVRRRAAEEAGRTEAEVDVLALLRDEDALVVEATAWACGERRPVADGTVEALTAVAADHEDPLCREAAVAALGAIGDPAGLPAILAATTDKPAVRRRAVIALAPFEGEDVEAALQRALEDRDRQVRQAAEDLLGD